MRDGVDGDVGGNISIEIAGDGTCVRYPCARSNLMSPLFAPREMACATLLALLYNSYLS